MSPELFVLLSGALTFGVPLALAIRELLELRRGTGGSEGRGRAPEVPAAPRSPAGFGPLPDCLIPKPLPVSSDRTREVEHA